MEAIFLFNTLSMACLCLLVFIWLGRSRFLFLKTANLKLCAARIGAAFGLYGLLPTAEGASVATCDVKNHPSSFVRHDLTSNDCRLRVYAIIAIIVSNTINVIAALAARGFRLGLRLLLLLALLLGSAYSARAATVMCSDFNGVVDGNKPSDFNRVRSASTFGIDMNCTIKNFPESVGGFPITNINFQFPYQQSYLIIFNNVYYDGNMSCNDPTQSEFSMWLTNDSFTNISSNCQEFFIPVDGIRKNNPAGQTTASIGQPFTYTLTFPDMAVLTDSGYVYSGTPDTDDIYHIQITDDLTATNADLTYVNDTAVLKNIDGSIIATHLNNSGDNKHLSFSYLDNPALALIPAGTQLVLEFQVVLDDTSANVPGKQFINTAHWELGRMIDGTNFEPLPGQDGITQPMTIVGPNLVVTKTSTMPNINIGTQAPYTINVQNTGGSDAWNTTITDNIPAGMCTYDPTSTVTAQIFASDGVTPVGAPLVNGTDYSVTWNGGSSSACQLSLQMLSDAAKIGPTHHLIINYQAMLDAGVSSGTFTNIAGATRWFSADSSVAGRREYDRTLTDGTPDIPDFQDAYTITAAVQGYYFLKSVEDLTTGAYPAKGAFAGDRLRYTLQIQNFNIPPLNGITAVDDLGAQNMFPAFVPGSLTLAGTNLPSGTYTVNPTGGTNGAGIVRIHDLNLASNEQYEIQFDVTLASNLTNHTIVSNQASLTGTVSGGSVLSGGSDDPYDNDGPAMLGSSKAHPTLVEIQTPGGPSKNSPTPSTATIGQQVSYRIAVPATPVNVPLYDVKIMDNLPANVSFVDVAKISGSGSWTPVNSGSDTNLIIQDTATGIDIPAGEQVVVEVTVKLLNTLTNVAGLNFTNAASYTYNKIDGNVSTQTPGGDSPDANMTVVEPNLTATKVASNVTPGKAAGDPITGGDIIQYVVTITNGGNATAYDVNVVDTLPSALTFYSIFVPTATINSSSVSSFVSTPAGAPAGPLVWGHGNGDGSLDIPAGDSLVLTYRVQVLDSTAATFSNQVWIDWTSLNGVSADERTGDGCPNTTAPNNYCFGPASETSTTTDNNNLTKAIVADSY
ncbi:MAG: hypothetical protein P8019_17120, partial [Gammaproteobacteria bacterium]